MDGPQRNDESRKRGLSSTFIVRDGIERPSISVFNVVGSYSTKIESHAVPGYGIARFRVNLTCPTMKFEERRTWV